MRHFGPILLTAFALFMGPVVAYSQANQKQVPDTIKTRQSLRSGSIFGPTQFNFISWQDNMMGASPKYGETIHADTRYSQQWLDEYKLTRTDEYVGSQRDCKIMEKIKIYNYFYRYGHLPPGNKIFR